MPETWNERLKQRLIQTFGHKKGLALNKKYNHAFPIGYIDEYPVEVAVSDIQQIEQLSADNRLGISFYYDPEREYPLHLRLYQWEKPIPLSDILPMLVSAS